ncbi:MAG: imidazolonepropionase [Bacteroidia bacterium]|nr:MAG: imidazolonepropionase [Bacteroidia bacterium]
MATQILIRNIKKLVQTEKQPAVKVCGKDMAKLPCIDNAFLLLQGDKIADFGSMKDLPEINSDTQIIDAEGKFVFPSFCDSHTHLVYAGSREIEYIQKIKGLSYEEIAAAGGGILNSSKLLNTTSEDELYAQSLPRVQEIISQGTGAVEIKSGYGLTLEGELKMLRVIKRLKQTMPVIIKANFLAAHAVPEKYKGKQSAYVDFIIKEILPQVAEEQLADFIDVFCDKGFFTVEDTSKILEAGSAYGLRGKIHANELDYSGGIQIGVKHQALSVDHLEYVGEAEIAALLDSDTMPTILPGAAFFLGMPFAPARQMIDAGLPLAVASDFNPGSSPSGNMKLMQSFAMVNYRMTAEEVVHATTINTAYAMGISNEVGSIAKGKRANVFITQKMPTLEFFPYSYGSNLIETCILNGKIVAENHVR